MAGCINGISSAPIAAPSDAQSPSGSSNALAARGESGAGIRPAIHPHAALGARRHFHHGLLVLAVGDEKAISGVTLRLVGVADDSRCPIDVTCVWAGDATVRLEARTERIARTPVVLHTAPERGQTAPFDRFTVTLLRLTPNRVSSRTIASEEYRVEVSLSQTRP